MIIRGGAYLKFWLTRERLIREGGLKELFTVSLFSNSVKKMMGFDSKNLYGLKESNQVLKVLKNVMFLLLLNADMMPSKCAS